jgi:hypothetical protein
MEANLYMADDAPADGYRSEDTGNQVYVIGDTWRAGGAGSTGCIMSEDVCGLKLADGTYAKIEVLSAQSARATFWATAGTTAPASSEPPLPESRLSRLTASGFPHRLWACEFKDAFSW